MKCGIGVGRISSTAFGERASIMLPLRFDVKEFEAVGILYK